MPGASIQGFFEHQCLVHPRKLTCPLKKDCFNRKYIFQPLVCTRHSLVFRGVCLTCFRRPGLRLLGHYFPPSHRDIFFRNKACWSSSSFCFSFSSKAELRCRRTSASVSALRRTNFDFQQGVRNLSKESEQNTVPNCVDTTKKSGYLRKMDAGYSAILRPLHLKNPNPKLPQGIRHYLAKYVKLQLLMIL